MPSPVLLRTLRVDVVTAEVFAALRKMPVDAVLLRGPAIARELYDKEGERSYGDCDILVPDASLSDAENVLATLGFTPAFAFAAGSGRRAIVGGVRSQHWHRQRDDSEVDLHRTLFGLGVGPAEAWSALAPRTHETLVAGESVRVLEREALAIVIVLHSVQHHGDLPHPSSDLERAIERWDMQVWHDALALAALLDAVDLFAAGLAAGNGGVALCALLGVSVSSRARRRAAMNAWRRELVPWRDVRRGMIVDRRAGRARLALLPKLMFPRPSELRLVYPRARHASGLRLMAVYARWQLRLARDRSAGVAVASWCRARRLR